MDQPIVLYRDAAGGLGAREDRCCHRGAALTYGTVVAQDLQCGYHGLIYDEVGWCVAVPGPDKIPPQTEVCSYRVVERQQFIWICMDDTSLADDRLIIDYPYHDQPDT